MGIILWLFLNLYDTLNANFSEPQISPELQNGTTPIFLCHPTKPQLTGFLIAGSDRQAQYTQNRQPTRRSGKWEYVRKMRRAHIIRFGRVGILRYQRSRRMRRYHKNEMFFGLARTPRNYSRIDDVTACENLEVGLKPNA